MENEIITMTSEDGTTIEFVIVDAAEKNGNKYILVIEKDFIDDEEADAEILKEVSTEGEEAIYSVIEDDEEFEEAAALFQEFNDDYEIEL